MATFTRAAALAAALAAAALAPAAPGMAATGPERLYVKVCAPHSSGCYRSSIGVATVTGGKVGPVRTLTPRSPGDTMFAVSPGGQHVVYIKSIKTGSALFVVDVATGTQTQFTHPHTVPKCGFIFDDSPSWSPDGKWITYVRGGTGMYCTYGGLFRITPAGTGRTRLPGSLRAPIAWSPGSTRIALSDAAGALLTASPSGTSRHVIGRSGLTYDSWAWSPSGSRIVYSTLRSDGYQRLYTIKASGGRPTLVASFRPNRRFYYFFNDLDWATDGSIWFDALDLGTREQIFRIAPRAGAKPVAVTRLSAHLEDPVLRP